MIAVVVSGAVTFAVTCATMALSFFSGWALVGLVGVIADWVRK